MDEITNSDDSTEPQAPAAADEVPTPPTSPVIDDELLLEEVSIDGMCGVY